jgi:NAD-dependent dihydropyrimidine dehydrogenase PreA subunit
VFDSVEIEPIWSLRFKIMAHEVKFDFKLCTACKTCVDVCFVDVIGWDEEKNIPTAKHLEDCQVCGVCVRNCPTNAITL